jgi:prolipoprotein diacylglyceryltransferase
MRPLLVDWLAQFMPRTWALLIAPSWFTMIGLAGVITLVWMLRSARKAGIDRGVIASAILWGYLAAVVAGIVVPMAIDAITHGVRTGHFKIHWAGMTSFWGYMAGGIAVALVARTSNVSGWRLGDLAAAPLGLALVSARLGCFIAGCDFGKVTSAPWAVRFPGGSPAWKDHVRAGMLPPSRGESLPVHPTQLYEATLGFVIVAVALIVARTQWARERAGRVAITAIACYAIGRLGVEELRADVGRGFFGPVSSGQLFSLLVLAALGGAWLWSKRRGAAVIAASVATALLVAGPGDAHADETEETAGSDVPGGSATAAGDEADAAEVPSLSIGLLAGWSAPLNRRGGQVPPLAGPSLSMGYRVPRGASLWIDFDSHGNEDAAHGTLLFSAQWDPPTRRKWSMSPRFGMGATLVNFDEPAFRDVTGLTMRAEVVFELEIAENLRLWVRPVSFDFLSANDLGGPIFSWQMRIGVGYEKKRKPKQPGGQAQPAPYYPPAPQPQPQPMGPGGPGAPAPMPTPTEPAPTEPAPMDPY